MEERKPELMIIGGDRRNILLRTLFQNTGYPVHSAGLPDADVRCDDLQNALRNAEAIILPVSGVAETIPVMAGNPVDTAMLRKAVRPSAMIFAGFASDDPRIINLNACEDYALQNAEATAEGAIAIALRNRDKTLSGTKCVVSGYGRIAKALVRLLDAFRADITVVCRNMSYADVIRSQGHIWASTERLAEILGENVLFFNTVPARLIRDEQLSQIHPACTLLELASKPYCCDTQKAQALGLNIEVCSGIPGKFFPQTAAEILFAQIQQLLKEGG